MPPPHPAQCWHRAPGPRLTSHRAEVPVCLGLAGGKGADGGEDDEREGEQQDLGAEEGMSLGGTGGGCGSWGGGWGQTQGCAPPISPCPGSPSSSPPVPTHPSSPVSILPSNPRASLPPPQPVPTLLPVPPPAPTSTTPLVPHSPELFGAGKGGSGPGAPRTAMQVPVCAALLLDCTTRAWSFFSCSRRDLGTGRTPQHPAAPGFTPQPPHPAPSCPPFQPWGHLRVLLLQVQDFPLQLLVLGCAR